MLPNFCSAPLPSTALSAWKPAEHGDFSVLAALAEARARLVGKWQGIAYNNFWALYAVSFTFDTTSHYSAQCQEHSDGTPSECCSALSYGTDKESELKQWTLSTVDGAGAVNGEVDVVYDYDNGLFQESSYQGKIVRLEFHATGNRARLDFVYGEVKAATYDLQRIP